MSSPAATELAATGPAAAGTGRGPAPFHHADARLPGHLSSEANVHGADLSDRQLEDRLCCQSAHVAVAECHLVLLVAEFDRRELWAEAGLRSCAHWLNWRCGTAIGTAREQLRVGRALADLPRVRAAFLLGQLSYSKVRALTRVATPDIEESLVELARFTTASQLEHLVREYRRADPDEAAAAMARHAGRSLRSYTDEDGMVVIHARLTPEDGAFVLAAIEAARQSMDAGKDPRDPGAPDVSAETPVEPVERLDDPGPGRADALVAVCETALERADPAVRTDSGALVLVHIDERVLEDPGEEGCCSADGVGRLAAHSARRLACDAAVSRIVYRRDGQVEAEGMTRSIPHRMRRGVMARDRGCRFPGCTQRRFVDLHHVVFWANGGPTAPGNLVCLCRFHHRLVHEGGYRLEFVEQCRLGAWGPDGRRIPAVPPSPRPTDPDIVTRHVRAGLDIDERTLSYCGEPLDYGIAVDGLLWQAGGQRRRDAVVQRAASTTAGRIRSVSVAS